MAEMTPERIAEMKAWGERMSYLMERHGRKTIPQMCEELEAAQQEIADLREALQSVLPVLEWKHAPDYARVPAVTRIKAALASRPPGETGGTT